MNPKQSPLVRATSRIFMDIDIDLVTTYAVQERNAAGDWETAMLPPSRGWDATDAIYLFRDAAEDHLKAIKAEEAYAAAELKPIITE